MCRGLLLLALVACLALPAQTLAYKEYPYLNAVASWLSQKPVEVRCYTAKESRQDLYIHFWGASAYVLIDEMIARPYPYAVFAWPICEDLRSFRAGNAGITEDSVWSVLVIVHESGHMRGSSFPFWVLEDRVNVWAIHRAYAVAVLKFGLADNIFAKFAFNRVVLDIYMGQPAGYRMADCEHPDLLPSGDIRCKT